MAALKQHTAGILFLVLAVGLVTLVVWDQTRGGDSEDPIPAVTKAAPEAGAAGQTSPATTGADEAEDDSAQSPPPTTGGIM